MSLSLKIVLFIFATFITRAEATLIADIATFGGSAVIKGAVKTGIKQGGKHLAKGIVKETATITKQATELSQKIGKNSISIKTPNKILHFDLKGATHKGIPTPHVQQSLPNINPKTGQIYWNKDRQWIQQMSQQDIRIIRNYLKRK